MLCGQGRATKIEFTPLERLSLSGGESVISCPVAPLLCPGWGRVYSSSASVPEMSWQNPPLQGTAHKTHASGHDITLPCDL